MTDWMPIDGHPAYLVSRWGQVYSRRSRRVLHPVLNRGYAMVGLAGRTTRVHVLVLEAFDRPRPKGAVCRHLDGNPINNHLSNLAWGTHKENTEDRKRHGRAGGRYKPPPPPPWAGVPIAEQLRAAGMPAERIND